MQSEDCRVQSAERECRERVTTEVTEEDARPQRILCVLSARLVCSALEVMVKGES
jgi:hypothetical protein